MQSIISQESCVRNTLGDRIKLQPNKTADKERSSFLKITMRYHHAVHTAAEHCSLGIRMPGMQRFINSLQIVPKVIEIPPDASLSLSFFCSPSLYLSLSICLSRPLSTTLSIMNIYTSEILIKLF